LIPIKSELKAVKAECSQLAKSGQAAKMLKVLVMLSGRVKEVSSEVIGLKEKVESLESELRSATKHRKSPHVVECKSSEPGDEMDELMDMFGTSHMKTTPAGATPERTSAPGQVEASHGRNDPQADAGTQTSGRGCWTSQGWN
jgi:hypothetical protein